MYFSSLADQMESLQDAPGGVLAVLHSMMLQAFPHEHAPIILCGARVHSNGKRLFQGFVAAKNGAQNVCTRCGNRELQRMGRGTDMGGRGRDMGASDLRQNRILAETSKQTDRENRPALAYSSPPS